MWPNPQETTDLVTFTEEILNGNLHFSRSALTILTESCIIDVWRSLKPSRHWSWWRRVEDVFSVTFFFSKTTVRHLWKVYYKHALKISWRRLEDVLEDQKSLRWKNVCSENHLCQSVPIKSYLILAKHLLNFYLTFNRKVKKRCSS